MPLTLLSKKSWNVYNRDNIDRVKRDEAAAGKRKRDLEDRTRDAEAAERWRSLGGHQDRIGAEIEDGRYGEASRKRKWSRSRSPDRQRDGTRSDDLSQKRKKRSRGDDDAPGADLDRISNMKFRDAAGRGKDSADTWYSRLSDSNGGNQPIPDLSASPALASKKRSSAKSRQPLLSDDPLAAMKKGVAQLRQAKEKRLEESNGKHRHDKTDRDRVRSRHGLRNYRDGFPSSRTRDLMNPDAG